MISLRQKLNIGLGKSKAPNNDQPPPASASTPAPAPTAEHASQAAAENGTNRQRSRPTSMLASSRPPRQNSQQSQQSRAERTSTQIAGTSTPQTAAAPTPSVKDNIKIFCVQDDIVCIPYIVEAVARSQTDAKVAAEQISKYMNLKKNSVTIVSRAFELFSTLVNHPGEQFTRHIGPTSIASHASTFVRTVSDRQSLGRAYKILDSFLMRHDLHLYDIQKAWLKDRVNMLRAVRSGRGSTDQVRMSPEEIFALGQQSVMNGGSFQLANNNSAAQRPSGQHPPHTAPINGSNQQHLRDSPVPIQGAQSQSTQTDLTTDIQTLDAAADVLADFYSQAARDMSNCQNAGPSSSRPNEGIEDVVEDMLKKCINEIQRLTPLLSTTKPYNPSSGVSPSEYRSQMASLSTVLDKASRALQMRNQVVLDQLLRTLPGQSGKQNGLAPTSARPSLAISRSHAGSSSALPGLASSSQALPSDMSCSPMNGVSAEEQDSIARAIREADLLEGRSQQAAREAGPALTEPALESTTPAERQKDKGKARKPDWDNQMTRPSPGPYGLVSPAGDDAMRSATGAAALATTADAPPTITTTRPGSDPAQPEKRTAVAAGQSPPPGSPPPPVPGSQM